MDNTMLIGLQTQRLLQRRMDITANNLANVDTTGFKADALVFKEAANTDAFAEDEPETIRFARDPTLMRDMGQGAIALTSNPLDVAIEGAGFIHVQGPNGIAYTRDGAFSMSGSGQLVTRDGRPVLNQGGQPIVFDAQGQTPVIGRNGAISVNGIEVGRIGASSFADPEQLTKIGDNLWSADDLNAQAFTGVLVQGSLEGSNVRPVVELTRLIEISRAYQSAARIVSNSDDLRQRAIERLGR